MITFESFRKEVSKINSDLQTEQAKAKQSAWIVANHIQKELINPLCEKYHMTFSTSEVIEGSFLELCFRRP